MLLTLVALPGALAHARTHHTEAWAREHYAAADRMREALNGRPPAERTRHDYQRVINAYRNVYYGAPTSTKADPSAVSVAEILVEMGRRFDDDKILIEAIAQYRFLRREYPGSKYRCDALFTIGEIYKDDLNDPDQAREVFADFLHRYPHNRLGEDARQAIAEMDRDAETETKVEAKKSAPKSAKAESGDQTAQEPKPAGDAKGKDSDPVDGMPSESAEAHPKPLPRVTGIRHWSTPDYTRVAIDLESEVNYGSQRISHPDRIFFDLRDTRLASTLVGKSFDVDDGFLKKIRVAQFQPGRRRVVLEVDDLADYDAFLLPNPYRLIIDIHGKNSGKTAWRKLPKGAVAAGGDVEAPPKGSSKNDDGSASAADGPDTKDAAPGEDLRAATGKVPVTTEDVGEDAKIVAKNAGTSQHPLSDLPRRIDNKKETPAPTKTIVDDDDDSADTPPSETHTPTRARSKTPPKVVAKRKKDDDFDVREARPTASGDRSLIRALGLKIGKIVIDPGHGGHDPGTQSASGIAEKDVALQIATRLQRSLRMLGMSAELTRADDRFLSLAQRTQLANRRGADLFVSIHLNSSPDTATTGIETYYLNNTTDRATIRLARMENEGSGTAGASGRPNLNYILTDLRQGDKANESAALARMIENESVAALATTPGIRVNALGAKQGPFYVLVGAEMPAVLVECGFLSNRDEAERLSDPAYQQGLADGIAAAIGGYFNNNVAVGNL